MKTEAGGRTLAGRYRLGELIGQGGMAQVWAATDERLGREVAVKVMLPALAGRDDVKARFEAEARAAARLAHPNVVNVFDTGEDEGQPFIVMERLPGETMGDRLLAGPADQTWLRRVAGDVLAALGAAHRAGVVHRDIKPGNVLIAADGCAKVADFGIAKSVLGDGDVDLTGTNLLIGTPAYLAPERIDGDDATPQSDLYALGVVLYEALAGTKPFTGATPVAIAINIRHEDPTPLAELRPDVDPRLDAAIRRAMHRDPAQRFASAAEMAEAIGVGGPAHEEAFGGAAAAAAATTAMAVPAADRTEAMSGTEVLTAPVAAAAPLSASAAVARRKAPLVPILIAGGIGAVVLLILIGVALASRGTDRAGDSRAEGTPAAAVKAHPASGGLRATADRVAEGDGPGGAEAAPRLRAIADQLDRGDEGGAASAATSLLRDATLWDAQNRMGDTAYEKVKAALLAVPGVDPAAAIPPERGDEKDDKDDDKGGKGGGDKKKDDD